jgi:hypothetical protein
MWEKVKKLEYEFPDGFDADARNLIEKILVKSNAPSLKRDTLN